jgi:hypothetical protein
MNPCLDILDKRQPRLSAFPRLVENVDTRLRAILGDAIFLPFFVRQKMGAVFGALTRVYRHSRRPFDPARRGKGHRGRLRPLDGVVATSDPERPPASLLPPSAPCQFEDPSKEQTP